MTTTGIVSNIQRFSTDDGPGIRTTVFLKGCPLRCAWCHNPEGISPKPELMWYDVRCIGVRDCLTACPVDALTPVQQRVQIDRQKCDGCGLCVDACPAGALEIIGQVRDADEICAELAKDRAFYRSSGSGVTLSGGEPLVQPAFTEALLRLCKNSGLHVALDTCGAVAWDRFERILPLVDLVLYDLKLLDSVWHRASTGADNSLIIDNARRIAAAKIPLWIRTPIIPGHTAGVKNIATLTDFIAEERPVIQRWDLLAYTNLGQSKYRRLGRSYALEPVPLCTEREMAALHRVAMQRVPVAVWSGATRRT